MGTEMTAIAVRRTGVEKARETNRDMEILLIDIAEESIA
jgi:hypothetical protein